MEQNRKVIRRNGTRGTDTNVLSSAREPHKMDNNQALIPSMIVSTVALNQNSQYLYPGSLLKHQNSTSWKGSNAGTTIRLVEGNSNASMANFPIGAMAQSNILQGQMISMAGLFPEGINNGSDALLKINEIGMFQKAFLEEKMISVDKKSSSKQLSNGEEVELERAQETIAQEV